MSKSYSKTVEKCSECPNWAWNCDENGKDFPFSTCKVQDMILDKYQEEPIPSWCPLPNTFNFEPQFPIYGQTSYNISIDSVKTKLGELYPGVDFWVYGHNGVMVTPPVGWWCKDEMEMGLGRAGSGFTYNLYVRSPREIVGKLRREMFTN